MPEYLRSEATISDCGTYRYRLVRVWDEHKPLLGFCLLNPSKADGRKDDQTVRKCVGFADLLGFGGMAIGNVYAYRATDPRILKRRVLDMRDPWGDNDEHLHWLASTCPTVIAGWGTNILAELHARHTLNILRVCPNVMCLGITKDGHPRHPLYLPYTTTPEAFR